MKKHAAVIILSGVITIGFVLFSAYPREVGEIKNRTGIQSTDSIENSRYERLRSDSEKFRVFFDSIPGGTFGIILRNLGLENVSASAATEVYQ